MSTPGSSSELDAILASYMEQIDRGEQVDIEEFIKAYPAYTSELREYFEAAGWFERKRTESPGTESESHGSDHPTTNYPSDAVPLHLPSPTRQGLDSTGLKHLGDFEILEEIARGGMGIVFKAWQLSLDRVVALKTILTGELANEDDIARFRAEAEAAGNLKHPNIVPVHSVGEERGLHYICMDFIDGKSLSAIIHQHPLSARTAAEYVQVVSRAVHFAHLNGVIHRDLKPSNILIDQDEIPHVTDFGLAKRTTTDKGVTSTGDIVGTLSYMSPEQASGSSSKTPASSDVYSLGAILYECLVGRAPFRADSPLETLKQLLETEPPLPRLLNPSIPKDLETICLKAMARDSAKRYPSAQELADDLHRWLEGKTIVARRFGHLERAWMWSKRKPAIAALTIAVFVSLTVIAVGSTVTAFVMNSLYENESEALAAAEDLRGDIQGQLERTHVSHGARLLENGDLATAALWFVEALKLSHGAPEAELLHRIRIGSVLNASPKPIQILEGSLQLTDDGEHVYSINKEGCRFLNLRTGRLLGFNPKTDGSVTPDFRLFISSKNEGRRRVYDIQTGKLVTTVPAHAHGIKTFSRDGTIALGSDGSVRISKYPLWKVESGELIANLHHSKMRSASFSPDGNYVGTIGNEHAQIWSARTGELIHRCKANSYGRIAFTTGDDHALPPADFHYLVRIPPEITPGVTACILGNGSDASPDGSRLISANGKLWDLKTQRAIAQLPAELNGGGFEFSVDGTLIISRTNRTAQVHDASNGRLLIGPISHSSRVYQATVSSIDETVRTTTASAAFVWDVSTKSPEIARERDLTVTSVSGEQFVSAKDNQITIRPMNNLSAPGRVLKLDVVPSFVASCYGDQHIWVGSGRNLYLLDAQDGHVISETSGYGKASIYPVVPSRDGKLLAMCVNTIQVLDAMTGKPVFTPLIVHHPIQLAEFTPDGKRLAAWHYDGKVLEVTFHSTQNGHRLGTVTIDGPNDAGRLGSDLILSPTDNVAIVCWSHKFHVFNTSSFKKVTQIDTNGRATGGAFSPGGTQFLLSTIEGEIQLWDTETWELLLPTIKVDGPSHAVVFSPDGSMFASSASESVRIWETSTGQTLAPPLILNDRNLIREIHFAPNNESVLAISGSNNQNMTAWKLFSTDRPFSDLEEFAQLISGHRINENGNLVPISSNQQIRRLNSLRAKYPSEFSMSELE